MSAPDRESYALRQAQLLDALLAGGGYPEGFVAARADAAGDALRRKRARAVAHAWPALALGLGESFGERFDAFARATGAPASGDPLEDGLRFARSLRLGRRGGVAAGDDARAELLLARAALARGPLLAAARLRTPRHRLLLVIRLPGLGRRHVAIGLERRRSR